MVQSRSASKNALHELGYKIFLDRYAQKDMTRKTLKVGDTVIVVVDSKTGQREIGTVQSIRLPKVSIQLLDGETVERDIEHVDKPIETDPGQMMDRVAAGIAKVEKSPKLRKQWTERFRWLLDDWKFVPAGRILAAAGTDQALTFYNCMPPEQEILTANGYRPLGEVRVGDLVVTHRNRLRPVLHKFERETEEALYIIKPKKVGFDDLRVTGDHKIHLIRSEWVNTHRYRDGLRLQQQPAWIPAKDVRVGDYVAVAYNGEECPPEPIFLQDYLSGNGYQSKGGQLFKPTTRGEHGYVKDWGTHYTVPERLDLDEDLCYLFGRWLGDGCVTHRTGTDIPSGIKIVFSLEEQAEAEHIAEIIGRKFGIEASIKLNSTGRWYDLWVNSMPLGQFFKAFLGCYSHSKLIADTLMHLPDGLTRALLRGLFQADGYISKNQVGILLSNRRMAVQVHQLLLRLGYLFSIKENTHRLSRVPAYRMQATANECGDLFQDFFDTDAPPASKTDLKYYFEYDGLKWVRIDDIQLEDYSGMVMDIEVAEDHSFVSAGVVVSNCYVIPSPTDSRGGIIETLRQMTEIMSRGGGVGINISSLRPRHAYVKGVNGRSSGAVSWGALYSFVTGLIEQGGCFGPDERILTDRGLIPAAELAERFESGEAIHAQTHQGLRRITARFRNGTKPLYEVTTARGYRVQITEDHKVAVLMDGNITTMALKYLQPGDEILLLLGNGVQAAYPPLKPVEYDRSVMSTTLNEAIRLPEVLDEELAYLIGYMHGDGYVQIGKKVTWEAPKAIKMATADAYPDIRERLVRSIERLFGYEALITPGTGAVHSVEIYSRLVVEWLAQNGLLKVKAEDIRVPEILFRAPSSVVGAFIAGYFDADGCDRGRKGGFGFDSISREMLGDIQQLLLANGIVSSIGTTDRSAQGWQTIYRLTVTGGVFKQRFAAFVPGEKVNGSSGTREMYHTYPVEAFQAVGVRSKYRQRIYDGVSPRISYGQITKIQSRLEADGQRETAARLDDLLCTLPDTIASIQPVGDSTVFDFEVDDVHLLSGAGVYTSNSRRGALMLILNDWHPDVFDFINSKRKAGQITNANISVGVSDRLMELVKTDGDWDLMFPDTSDPAYDEGWDGDIDRWMAEGHKVIVYRTVKARQVWDAIIESAWASAEPGVFFRERYNKMSNSWYHAPIISTNPCVTGDTPVATEFGYTKARDLQVGMKIRTPAGLKRIAKVYNNGVQPIFQVRFSDGGSLDCTADHKLKVVRGKKYEWVAVSDLRQGDKVLVSANEAFGSRRRLPEAAQAYVQKRRLNVAEYYDRRLGLLVGAVIGDGTLRQIPNGNSHQNMCKVAFGTRETAWQEHFQGVLTDMGIHTHVAHSGKDIPQPDGTVLRHESLAVDCYKLATLLIKLGMQPNVKAPQKAIPEAFMSLDRDFLAGVLDGLFSTDGNVSMKRDNPLLRFTTSSPELAQQVRLLLLQFGIHARIYQTTRKADLSYDGRSMLGTGVKYDVAVMNEGIARFYSEIGLSNPGKAARLKEVAENWHYLGGTWTASVVAVEPTGREEEVFDVFEPDTLTWVTNGYVSFDCGEQGLPGWGVCNLGAINLARFYDEDAHDVKWDELDQAARYATRFLDNVIDSTLYFFDENRRQQLGERRVGLNNMGLAELMIKLGIRYGSDESVAFIDKLYGFLARAIYETSIELAREKGAFPKFEAEKFLQSGYMESMPEDIREKVRQYGIRNVTLTTQAPTGCVAPDTLVSMATGLRPIVELGDPNGMQWQVMSQAVHTDEGLRQTSHFYINGRAAVKRMTTRRGFTLTATPNHRIRIIDAGGDYVWRRMDELQAGDQVVLKKDTLGEGERVRLTPVEQGNRALSALPEAMTLELAELLGLYMGDGYTKARGGLHIVVAKRDPDLREHVADLLRRVWGEHHEVLMEDREGCWVANLNGYYIPRFFTANGFAKPSDNHGEGAEGAFIPSKVLQAGRQHVAAFLRGLFEADGSVYRGTITLVSTSRTLIQQAQVALLGLGIVATMRQLPESEGRFGERPRFELRILNRQEAERFVQSVGFISERKRAAAADLGAMADRGDSVAVPALCEEFYAQSKGLKDEVRQQIVGLVSNGALTQQFVKQTATTYPILAETRLAQLAAKDVYLDVVESIEDDVCLTYDLSVPDNKTYIANGFVSHNTTGTMVNTSTGIEPFFSWVYYRKSRLGLHEEQVPLVKEWYEQHPGETKLPDYFVTAMDLSPEEHIKVQAAIQRWVDSSISKTCNVPNHYTVEQVSDLYKYMYELGCKGGTIYRDGSRDEQVLMLKGDERAEKEMADRKKDEKPSAPVTVTVEQVATPHRVYPRPKRLAGVTVSRKTPFGTAYITMNSDELGNPFEVFITVGKAGSDLQADAEGLGRMVSLQLRTTAPQNRMEMVKLIVDQLQGIGGSRSVGLGPQRVISLPDAVAGALVEHYLAGEPARQLNLPMGNGSGNGHQAESDPAQAALPSEELARSNGEVKGYLSGADLCPNCGTVSLVRIEGCEKCLTCDYIRC
jgi:ribonucleotide reductase alpha subunit